jgi:hypothetical protein
MRSGEVWRLMILTMTRTIIEGRFRRRKMWREDESRRRLGGEAWEIPQHQHQQIYIFALVVPIGNKDDQAHVQETLAVG